MTYRLRVETVSGLKLLNETYAEIMQRNTGDKHEMPQRHLHATKLYSTVLAASIPFTLDMLVDVIATNDETPKRDPTVTQEYVLDLARDMMVEVPGTFFQGIALDFAHVSVKEYLEQSRDYTSAKTHWSMITSLRSVLQDAARWEMFIHPGQISQWYVHDLVAFYALCMWALHWHCFSVLYFRGDVDACSFTKFATNGPEVFSGWLKTASDTLNSLPASGLTQHESNSFTGDILQEIYTDCEYRLSTVGATDSTRMLAHIHREMKNTVEAHLNTSSPIGRPTIPGGKESVDEMLPINTVEIFTLMKITMASLLTFKLMEIIYMSEHIDLLSKDQSLMGSTGQPSLSQLPRDWGFLIMPYAKCKYYDNSTTISELEILLRREGKDVCSTVLSYLDIRTVPFMLEGVLAAKINRTLSLFLDTRIRGIIRKIEGFHQDLLDALLASAED